MAKRKSIKTRLAGNLYTSISTVLTGTETMVDLCQLVEVMEIWKERGQKIPVTDVTWIRGPP